MCGIKQQMAAISSGRWVGLIVGGSNHQLSLRKICQYNNVSGKHLNLISIPIKLRLSRKK